MRTFLIAGAAALLAAGCGGGGGSDTPVPVAQIAVTPTELKLTIGESMQLGATVRDAGGNVLQGRSIHWSSNDTAKVSVTGTGTVRAVGPGNATVTATVEGRNASAAVVVVEPAGTISYVIVDPVSALLEEGTSTQLEAIAYDDRDNVVTGRAVRWATSDAGIASVDPAGLVTGLRPGIVRVTATVDGREASASMRIFAEYPFELLHSSADIEMPDLLYSLEINDPAAVSLPVFGPDRTASHAAPSPDGTRIAYVVHGRWDGTFWQSMIFAADRDGGNVSRLTFLEARSVEPAWSPDGSRIAFSSQVFGENAEIWVMDADGANLTNLTADQPDSSKRSPAWSPRLADGSYRLAYALETAGSGYIWSMRDDGGDKLGITQDPRYFDAEPNWSPDGNTLVFLRTGDAIFSDLYVVQSTGGAGRALMPANPLAFGQFGPVWSPDGRLIAFTSKHADGTNYQVWTVWADGSRLVQRTHELRRHADPAWIVRLY